MATRQASGLRYAFIGFMLIGVAKAIELRGDLAPVAAAGVSGERLFYHGLALVALIGALVSFLRGGYLAFRRIANRVAPPGDALVKVFTEDSRREEEADDFDPDAALARYMERKREGTAEPTVDVRVADPTAAPPPSPRPGPFGRKGI